MNDIVALYKKKTNNQIKHEFETTCNACDGF